tara:strand:+ start:5636 stop:6688 length:1053 start_codon:yes stop_codon:yes gene_type:complete
MVNINFYKNTTANIDAGNVIKYPIESNLTISKPSKGYKKVIFCMYKKIDIEDKHFLQYLLYKNKDTSNLYMPFIDEKDSVKDFIKKVIDKERYTLLGYRIFKECLLTFISLINADTELILHKKNDMWWWATIDEIVNLKSVYSYKIDPSVTEIFYMNQDMCFLLDEKSNKLQTPLTCYKSGDNLNTLDFQIVYGFFRSSIWNTLGPFYNFRSFDEAITMSRETIRYVGKEDYKVKNDKLGIIRVAVFMGKTKVFINSENDKESSYSDVELKQLEDKRVSDKQKSQIRNFRRMNDFEGDWSSEYDSAQIGNIVEKDKVVYYGFTSLSLKDRNNIIILSYSEINENKEDPLE